MFPTPRQVGAVANFSMLLLIKLRQVSVVISHSRLSVRELAADWPLWQASFDVNWHGMFPDNLREAAQRVAAGLNLFGDMNGNPYVGNNDAPPGGTMGPNPDMGVQTDVAQRDPNLLSERDIAFRLQADSRLHNELTPVNNYGLF